MATDLTFINAALTLTGNNPITSLTDGSVAAKIAGGIRLPIAPGLRRRWLQAVRALQWQASDPGFFQLTGEGEDAE